jgi:hypothetical protein
MAAPLAGATSAVQIAQQKAQEQSLPKGPKQEGSKFDQVMTQKAQANRAPDAAQKVQATQSAQATQKVNQVNQVRQVEQVSKAEKAGLLKVDRNQPTRAAATTRAADPVAAKAEVSKSTTALTRMISDMEKGQGTLDKLISGGLSGKEFSSTELLALQAGMYKYTQELELTGKVVEKATSGLKDTLKTQV